MMENNENVLDKISKLAFTTAIIGICTIGICPAFGAIGIAAPLVMKHKKAKLSKETQARNKKAVLAGIISLVMFVLDIVLLTVFGLKLGWLQ
ncbi:MAG: hypothetical protein K1V95_00120 [Eubacterium sp.]